MSHTCEALGTALRTLPFSSSQLEQLRAQTRYHHVASETPPKNYDELMLALRNTSLTQEQITSLYQIVEGRTPTVPNRDTSIPIKENMTRFGNSGLTEEQLKAMVTKDTTHAGLVAMLIHDNVLEQDKLNHIDLICLANKSTTLVAWFYACFYILGVRSENESDFRAATFSKIPPLFPQLLKATNRSDIKITTKDNITIVTVEGKTVVIVYDESTGKTFSSTGPILQLRYHRDYRYVDTEMAGRFISRPFTTPVRHNADIDYVITCRSLMEFFYELGMALGTISEM